MNCVYCIQDKKENEEQNKPHKQLSNQNPLNAIQSDSAC